MAARASSHVSPFVRSPERGHRLAVHPLDRPAALDDLEVGQVAERDRDAAACDQGEVAEVFHPRDVRLGHHEEHFGFPILGLEAAERPSAQREAEDLGEVPRADAEPGGLLGPRPHHHLLPGVVPGALDVGHPGDAGNPVLGFARDPGEPLGVLAVEPDPEEHAGAAGCLVVVAEHDPGSGQGGQHLLDPLLHLPAFGVGDVLVHERDHRLRLVLGEVAVHRSDPEFLPDVPEFAFDGQHREPGVLLEVEVVELVGEIDAVAVGPGEHRGGEPEEERQDRGGQEGGGDAGGDPAAAQGEAQDPIGRDRPAARSSGVRPRASWRGGASSPAGSGSAR